MSMVLLIYFAIIRLRIRDMFKKWLALNELVYLCSGQSAAIAAVYIYRSELGNNEKCPTVI
jgi:hypothetical protein